MGWYIAIDTRDGQKMAFPEASSAITNDVDALKKALKGQVKCATFALDAIRQVSHDQLEGVEPPESLKGLIKAVNNTIEHSRKTDGIVESLIFFDGGKWPVRAVRYVTERKEVDDFLNGTEGSVPLEEIPVAPAEPAPPETETGES